MLDKTILSFVGFLSFALLLGGCCSVPERGDVDLKLCSILPEGQATAEAATLTRQCQAISRNKRQPEIIALSGGGAYGAWGSGVLLGWGENSTYERPKEFDVVTGISTGSLQSTFVFLGKPGDYKTLSEAYLSIDNDDIYRDRGILCALTSNSFRDQTSLLRTLEKWIRKEVIDRVANEAGIRKLYVGTVDLDCGQFCIWDMVEVARQKNYDGYRRILLAAASIPLLAPPVELDGHLHADAGVREQIFLKQILIPICESYRERLAADEQWPPPRLHLLVNGGLGVKPQIVENRLLRLAFRTLSMVLDQGMIGNLCEINRLVDEYHIALRVAWIPPCLVPDTGSEDFDPCVMAKLHKHGTKWGKTTDGWVEEVPPLPFIGPKTLSKSVPEL